MNSNTPAAPAAILRILTEHKVKGLNEALEITVIDEPGQGGACHRYDITGFNTDTNPSGVPALDGYWDNLGGASKEHRASNTRLPIVFQNGPIQEHGVNGISHEALLAILIDRLSSFQAGPYAHPDNELALTMCEEALRYLHKRTRERLARGVEGTRAK